ncbi:PREDICTED: cation/H(+) antiporter 15-like [Nelumbo nucifera]|nr:PREDICTED: cation/H(+) antiporter 15-like [Nelumbo nucifera]
MDSYMRKALSFVGAAESIVAFPVVATLLTDLRIINTEMGQLALSSSIINDIFNVSFAMVSTNLKLGRISRRILLYALSANVGYLIFVVFVIRPIMLWVVRNTPEGKPVKKAYIRFILVVALMSSFCSIIMGHNAYMGPLLLGLAVPDGPPLGSALVDRLESFVSGLMLPLFLTVSGLRTNFYKIQGFKFVGALALVMLTANFGKLTAATLSLLYFKAPLTEALCLGFIMSSKGIVEMSIYNVWKDEKILDEGLFSVLVMSVALAATFMPMFATVFYNRSIEYADIRRQRNIPRHKQIRIMVCILTHENVAIMIRMLQASNPSIRKPIHVCTLHLIQLVGRASPVLLCHTTSMKPKPSPSERIINVFHCFERSLCGAITFQAFSAMSPRELMHNDIWKIAHQEDISLIILPFHKTCEIGGTLQQASGSAAFGAAVRNLNLNVLATAPCSVGLIIDRGLFAASTTAMSLEQLSLRVAVIFLGGADDRGALLHASRMVEGPTTASLQVTQLILSDCSNPNDWNVKFDTAAITNFKSTTSHCKNVFFREEVVEDEEQMVKIIRSIHTSSDLILVGRRHTMESQIMAGIGEWSEFPELGVIGDVLASSDTDGRFSVLVWQHQAG